MNLQLNLFVLETEIWESVTQRYLNEITEENVENAKGECLFHYPIVQPEKILGTL